MPLIILYLAFIDLLLGHLLFNQIILWRTSRRNYFKFSVKIVPKP